MNPYYLWIKNRWCDLLIAVYTLVIYYTTLTPFSFALDPGEIQKNLSRIEWVPYLLRLDFYSGSDILINLILFIPLGMLLAEAYRWRGVEFFPVKTWLLITLYGFLVSFSVELIQNFTYNRFSQSSDLLNNTLGTLVGAWILQVGARKYRRQAKMLLTRLFARKAEMLFAAAAVLLLLLLQLAPFDFQLNVEVLKDRLIAIAADPFKIDSAFQTWIPAAASLAFVSAFFGIMGRHRYFSTRQEQRLDAIILLAVWAISAALEAIQFIMIKGRHSLVDVAVMGLSGSLAWIMVKMFVRSPWLNESPNACREIYYRVLFWTGVGYFGFRLYLFGANFDWTTDALVINSKWAYALHPYLWLRQAQRLQMIAGLLGFAANAGGFLMLLLVIRSHWLPKITTEFVVYIAIAAVCGTVAIQFFALEMVPHWSQLVAGGMGLSGGRIVFEIMDYLLSTHYTKTVS